jgi:periplasmic copper chaperone A
MKRFFMLMLTTILLLGGCDAATGITVNDAWARPAAQDGNGAVYFLLQNHSSAADELIAVTSDVAEATELHESKMTGDVMQMQQVMSLPIQGKASIEFAPGGYHVMLIGLKQDLRLGDEFQIRLQFKTHEEITLTVPVQETGGSDSIRDH